jgi:hypothetical protein
MDYEHQEWLLDMVDELKLHPRVAKLRGKTPEQEWEMLDRMVDEELRLRDERKKEGTP